MIELYPQIKWVHVVAVIASGSLFTLRGAGTLIGWRWPMHAAFRYLSYSIDTVLLAAAVMLAGLLHQYPFVHAWLTVKVILLVGYIVLGSFALKRAPTKSAQCWSYAGALLLFLCIISVARTHHPLGFASGLLTAATQPE
jgi:uncharacterized membrane protein SirB2